MIIKKRLLLFFAFLFLISFSACKSQPERIESTDVEHYPIDSLEGVVMERRVQFDEEITSDGNGSFRINAEEPIAVRLYETGDIDIENAQLIYEAQVRTEGVVGQVYLEMWCVFADKGEFFSRALRAPISGTKDWRVQRTPFFLKKGENPDNVKLNLVINGIGKAWIDDIHLKKAPLPK